MRDGIMLTVAEDGTARVYDDTYDIVIHCESQEEHDKAMAMLRGMTWVLCSERLPEENETVLITDEDGDVYAAYYTRYSWGDNERIEWWVDDFIAFPIAWMPLPEPWKGEEHETD